jgi:hypothetical protein
MLTFRAFREIGRGVYIRTQVVVALAQTVSPAFSHCHFTIRPFVAVVDSNPKAFSKAYWEINSLRIYTAQ